MGSWIHWCACGAGTPIIPQVHSHVHPWTHRSTRIHTQPFISPVKTLGPEYPSNRSLISWLLVRHVLLEVMFFIQTLDAWLRVLLCYLIFPSWMVFETLRYWCNGPISQLTVLHVGCGQASIHPYFAGPRWKELRVDINAANKPDIVADMSGIRYNSFNLSCAWHA